MMGAILKGDDADTAAVDWLKDNPAALDPWLAGVTTFDGGPASTRSRRASASEALRAEVQDTPSCGSMGDGRASTRQMPGSTAASSRSPRWGAAMPGRGRDG